MNSDSNQLAAIKHKDGPAMVLAGPGSGKTRVLTHRVRYLIDHYQVPPDQILVFTFSKAAAVEMEERFGRLSSGKDEPVTFGTFHAIFRSFLIRYSSASCTILKESAQISNVKHIFHRMNLPYPSEDYLKDVLDDISRFKSGKTDGYKTGKDYPGEVFAHMVKAYDTYNQSRREMDYDDILLHTYQLLAHDHKVLSCLRKRYSYVLVDEFQDINAVQYGILHLLCEEHKNLFIVGDDDQSIYAFRGGSGEYMFRMKEDYPDLITYPLWNNYRSKAKIVETSMRLIANNTDRFEKTIRSASPGQGIVRPYLAETQAKQYERMAELIKSFPFEERGDTAILIRNNRISPKLKEIFYKNGIAIVFGGKTADITASDAYRDLKDLMSAENQSLPGLYERMKYRLNIRVYESFRQKMRFLKEMDPYAAVIYIEKGMGYGDYLDKTECVTNEDPRKRRERDVFEYIKSIAKEYDTAEKLFLNIHPDRILNTKQETGAVKILTMHGSKGLEYRRVILPDLVEGILPKKGSDPRQTEEERRLLYVAVTRAREELYLFGVRSLPAASSDRKKPEQIAPSRFLLEMLV